ncbi:MAG: hypothetical protein LBV08_01860 [Clostridiales bacterium]|jgi:hypothetical protein|nr:hypothetical protein [Clostridiales bacterium]
MDEQLKQLSIQYINSVEEICLIMLSGLKINSKKELLRYGLKKQIGEFYFNGEHKYMFHGIGCKLSNDNIIIDWDFGIGDMWCCIDPWKLQCYLKENKKVSNVYEIKYIQKEYDKAVGDGEMIKKGGLYYFVFKSSR